MPVCSYLVIPEPGAGDEVARCLESLPSCDLARAENRELLLLVTDTPGPEEDRDLRDRIEAVPGVHALVLAFGEIDPDTGQSDPVREERRRSRLPVVDPGGLAEVPTVASPDRPGQAGNGT